MIKILIADDHPLVRLGLKRVINTEPDMQVAGEASTALEALNLVRQTKGDLLILDISMPGRSGLDILQEVHEEYPSLPILSRLKFVASEDFTAQD